jgi:integrase
LEVEPVRNKEEINRIYRWLSDNYTVREAELWLIGCNVALRASDLLSIRFDQIEGKTHVNLTEKKTKKKKRFPITQVVRDAAARLRKYYESKQWYKTKEFVPTYLFQSTSRRVYHLTQPVCIQWVSEVFKDAQAKLELEYNFNTHSMRKTWGFHAYEGGEDIHYIQALLNHSRQDITLRYIGVTKTALEKMYFTNTLEIA